MEALEGKVIELAYALTRPDSNMVKPAAIHMTKAPMTRK